MKRGPRDGRGKNGQGFERAAEERGNAISPPSQAESRQEFKPETPIQLKVVLCS